MVHAAQNIEKEKGWWRVGGKKEKAMAVDLKKCWTLFYLKLSILIVNKDEFTRVPVASDKKTPTGTCCITYNARNMCVDKN